MAVLKLVILERLVQGQTKQGPHLDHKPMCIIRGQVSFKETQLSPDNLNLPIATFATYGFTTLTKNWRNCPNYLKHTLLLPWTLNFLELLSTKFQWCRIPKINIASTSELRRTQTFWRSFKLVLLSPTILESCPNLFQRGNLTLTLTLRKTATLPIQSNCYRTPA